MPAGTPWTDYIRSTVPLNGAPVVTFESGDPDYPVTERRRKFQIGKVPAYASAEPDAVRFPNNVLVEKREMGNDGHFVEVYLRYQRLPGKTQTLNSFDNDTRTDLYTDRFMAAGNYSLPARGSLWPNPSTGPYYVDDARKSPLAGSTLAEVVVEYSAVPANRVDYIERGVSLPGWFLPVRGDFPLWTIDSDDGSLVVVNKTVTNNKVIVPLNEEAGGVAGVSLRQLAFRPGVNVDVRYPRNRVLTCRRTRIFLAGTDARERLVKQLPKRFEVLSPAAASAWVGRFITENTIHNAFDVYGVDMRAEVSDLLLESFEASDPPAYDPKSVYVLSATVHHWKGAKYYMELLQFSEATAVKDWGFIGGDSNKVTIPFIIPAANTLVRRLDELDTKGLGFILRCTSTSSSDGGTKRLRIIGRKMRTSSSGEAHPFADELVTLGSANTWAVAGNRWWRLFAVQLVTSATNDDPTNATGTITVRTQTAKSAATLGTVFAFTGLGAAGDTVTVTYDGESETYTCGIAEITILRFRNGSSTLPAGGVGTPVEPASICLSHGADRYGIVVYRSNVGEWDNGENYYTGVLGETITAANIIECGVTSALSASQLRDAVNTALSGHTAKWTTATSVMGGAVDTTGDVGQHNSLAAIGGKPAIAYYDATNGDLKFAINAAADGSGSWTTSTVASTGSVGQHCWLAEISGKPAIAYYDATNGDLKFAINAAADGSGSWTITDIEAGADDFGRLAVLGVVDGRPAAAYIDWTLNELRFAINSAANGSGSWTTYLVVSVGAAILNVSMATIGGRPAIAYYDSTDLKFVRASNAGGTAWGSPVTASAGVFCDYRGVSLAEVSGKPAIAYCDTSAVNGLSYVRANDDAGASWGTPTTCDSNINCTYAVSLVVVDGKPAVGYARANAAYFVRSSDVYGTAWGTPVSALFLTGNAVWVSMAVIDGCPAIGTYDNTNTELLWARSLDAAGQDEWGVVYNLTLTHVAIGSVTNAAIYEFAAGDDVSITQQGVGSTSGNVVKWSAVAADMKTRFMEVLNDPANAISLGYCNAGTTTPAALAAGLANGDVTLATVSSTSFTLTVPFVGDAAAVPVASETGTTVTITNTDADDVGSVVATIAAASSSAYQAISLDNSKYDFNVIPRVELTTEPIGVGTDGGVVGGSSWKLVLAVKDPRPVKFTVQVCNVLGNWVTSADGPFYVAGTQDRRPSPLMVAISEMATHTYGGNSVATKYVRLKVEAETYPSTVGANARVYAAVEHSTSNTL